MRTRSRVWDSLWLWTQKGTLSFHLVNKTEPLSKTLYSENTGKVTKIQICQQCQHTLTPFSYDFYYLHWIFSPAMKQGPVMLTTVPPNMLPLSGANINGRFAPAAMETLWYLGYMCKHWIKNKYFLQSILYCELHWYAVWTESNISEEHIRKYHFHLAGSNSRPSKKPGLHSISLKRELQIQ